jgi:hypothetical protein
MKRAVLALCALAMLAAAPNPLTQTYIDGETLDYDLQWLRVTGGTARMTIQPLDEHRYRITSIGKSSSGFARIYKVRDEIATVVTRDTFSTLNYRKTLNEGGSGTDRYTVVDPVTHIATHRGDEFLSVPPVVFDPLSLVYYMRGLELAPGKVLKFPILADGKLKDVEADVLNREQITTAAGRFDCIVVYPKSDAGIFRDKQSKLLIWYTDDWRHIPVRIRSDVKFGSITASLHSVSSGVWSEEPGVPRQSK